MPFSFNIKWEQDSVNKKIFATNLEKGLIRIIRRAATIYYNTLINIIHVDTGFLAGSFDAIKRATAATGIPKLPRISPGHNKRYRDGFGTNVQKSPTGGQAFASKVDDVLTLETDLQTTMRVTFEYENAIRYYPVNDIYGRGSNPPWGATIRAHQAMLKYIEQAIIRIIPEAIDISIEHKIISFVPGQTPHNLET